LFVTVVWTGGQGEGGGGGFGHSRVAFPEVSDELTDGLIVLSASFVSGLLVVLFEKPTESQAQSAQGKTGGRRDGGWD
jgi:hypothetical protein